jgi:hypothetical protein
MNIEALHEIVPGDFTIERKVYYISMSYKYPNVLRKRFISNFWKCMNVFNLWFLNLSFDTLVDIQSLGYFLVWVLIYCKTCCSLPGMIKEINILPL